MNKKQLIAIVIILAAGGLLGWRILNTEKGKSGDAHEEGHGESGHEEHGNEHGAHAAEEPAKGSHGGRLLTSGNFQTEVTIFERGVPPQYRIYFYEKNKLVDPAEVKLGIELHRLGGRVDRFEFKKEQDYLVGDKVVEEPHSFDVKVAAEHKGKTHHWEYGSYEGRTELSPEAVKSSGIVVEDAGPAPIRTTLKLFGKIGPNEDRLAHVLPRYPGVVKKVNKRVGEKAAKGEVLAVIESSESLQPYEVRSEIDGTVVEKDITVGEVVPQEKRIFVVVDLSTVWVNLNVYRQDFTKMRLGQEVILDPGVGLPPIECRITYISPFGADSTQTMLARAEIPNPGGWLRPGLFIEGHAVLEEVEVDVAVKDDALQTMDNQTVVFVQEGDAFEARPVMIGRQGGGWVEITQGLLPGDRYVATNSFILKADIGKAGAAHDH